MQKTFGVVLFAIVGMGAVSACSPNVATKDEAELVAKEDVEVEGKTDLTLIATTDRIDVYEMVHPRTKCRYLVAESPQGVSITPQPAGGSRGGGTCGN